MAAIAPMLIGLVGSVAGMLLKPSAPKMAPLPEAPKADDVVNREMSATEADAARRAEGLRRSIQSGEDSVPTKKLNRSVVKPTNLLGG